jgi:hypothetical protein
MSALPSIVRRSALVSTMLGIAGAFAPPALAQNDCRFVAGLPEAYAELAQTELHATPPVHPVAKVPGDPDRKIPVDPTVATHGQLLLGQTILYHLPVFMTDPWSHPHNFQVVLEVALSDTAQAAIADSQAAHPESIHTAVPPVFAQTSLVVDVPGHPRKASFADLLVFRNHFENRFERVDVARSPAKIVRVLHFREFAPDLPKPAELAYAVFGSGDDTFLAHLLSAPPDFDQILKAEIAGAPADLNASAGWSLGFATRSNKVGDRLQVGEEVRCATPDDDTITVRVVAEPYCEIGEFTHIVGEVAGNPFFGTPTPCPGA